MGITSYLEVLLFEKEQTARIIKVSPIKYGCIAYTAFEVFPPMMGFKTLITFRRWGRTPSGCITIVSGYNRLDKKGDPIALSCNRIEEFPFADPIRAIKELGYKINE